MRYIKGTDLSRVCSPAGGAELKRWDEQKSCLDWAIRAYLQHSIIGLALSDHGPIRFGLQERTDQSAEIAHV